MPPKPATARPRPPGAVDAVLAPPAPTSSRPGSGSAPLNPRDLQVLVALAQGRSTAQIASVLAVSRNTARTRIRRLQGKLAVVGRDGVVRVAHELQTHPAAGPQR
ncbi:LuxR C-terminal-related transcriptional regulator [Blastococcus sp. SYSU D00695]